MVASGIGITVLPIMAAPKDLANNEYLHYLPFLGAAPSRRIVLAWRKSFTRSAAIDAIRRAVLSVDLSSVTALPNALVQNHSH